MTRDETQTRERGAKTTPALAAGVADHVSALVEIIGVIHEKPAGRFKRIGEAA